MTDLSERLAAAENVALTAHGDQLYGDQPYRHHLVRVFSNAKNFGADADTQVAAWLHDAVEDTELTLDDVRQRFGDRVAELVDAVTDEPGKNRAQRHAATWPKTRRIPGGVTLKLCDRLANVAACFDNGSAKIGMYRKEYPHFRAALHPVRPHGVEAALWDNLDVLMDFPVDSTDPRQHPVYREYRRRMAQQPQMGNGSRTALDELDQIGIWAAQWVDEHASDEVRAIVLAELQDACADHDRREYWDKEGSALRVLEASGGG